MLVINRKKDQEVVLGDDIRIVILAVKKNKVKFGVQAPPDVTIARRTRDDDSAKANISVAHNPTADQAEGGTGAPRQFAEAGTNR